MPSKKAKSDQDTLSKTTPQGKSKSSKGLLKSTMPTIFQVKITLDDIRPPIWRQIQTKDCTLHQLHDLLQAVMGWEDYHLHEFEVGRQRYGDPVQWQDDIWDDESEIGNEKKIKLSQLAAQGVKKFRYQYDMGDSWWHTIKIEKKVSAEPGAKYPRCTGGERACPPEDCGGPWGYGDFVDAIQNPKNERHDELLDWVGGEFDPEEFDLEAANKKLTGAR